MPVRGIAAGFAVARLQSVERLVMGLVLGLTGAFAPVFAIAAEITDQRAMWAPALFCLVIAIGGGVLLVTSRLTPPMLAIGIVIGGRVATFVMPAEAAAGMMVGIFTVTGLAAVFTTERWRWRFHGVLALLVLAQLLLPNPPSALIMLFQAGVHFIVAASATVLVRAVATGAERFQILFDRAPISIWEEDFSGVADRLEHLRATGVTDLRSHLRANLDELRSLVALVQVNSVNRAAADLVGVADPAELLGGLDLELVARETAESWIAQMVAVWEHRSDVALEFDGGTAAGGRFTGVLNWAATLDEDGSPDYRRVIVSISNVSELKQAQRDLASSIDRLNAVAEAQASYIDGADLETSLESLLAIALETSGAHGGALGAIRDDGVDLLANWGTGFEDGFSISSSEVEALAPGASMVTSPRSLGVHCDGSLLVLTMRPEQGRRSVLVMCRDEEPFEPADASLVAPLRATAEQLIRADAATRARSEAEKALRTNQEKLQAIFRSAPVVLFSLDEAGRFSFVEGLGLKAVGLGRERVLGRSLDEVFPDRPDVVIQAERVRRGETIQETFVYGGRQLELRCSPLRGPDGSTMGIMGVAVDVTEAKQAREALRAAEERTRMVVERMNDLLVTVDRSGTVTFATPSIERILGYLPADVVGLPLRRFIHPEDIEALEHAARASVDSGPPPVLGFRAVTVAGVYRDMEATATNLLDDEGRTDGWVVTVRDVTERNAAHLELLAAKEAAEDATKAKSQFLANVSHEIRTPMNAILGMSTLALQTELDEEQRDYVSTVRTSAESLLTLINDLLDLAKIEAGKLEVEHIPFDVRGAIDETMRVMQVRAAEKRLDLGIAVERDVPATVVGDPGRLRQIIYNLVSNAVKFTEYGRVDLSVSAMDRHDDRVRLRFEVTDTGIGIDADKLGSIFEAFRQADGSMTRRFGGTGLGLAICSELVEAMGGTIDVESRVGAGSSFTFEVDFDVVEDDLGNVASGPKGEGVVLFVRRATSEALLVDACKGAGLVPVCITAPEELEEGLRRLEKLGRRALAVVVDLDEETVETAAKLASGESPPVVALPNAGSRGDGPFLGESGVAAYLPKPFEGAELGETIRAAADRPDNVVVTRHWLRQRKRAYHVLVADDSPTNRKLASLILAKQGHTVEEVADGCEAVAAVATGDFDAVLMDVQMPEMDGIAATREIRALEDPQKAATAIIALTAHAMESDRERCLAAGMDAYLSKPFRAEELASVLRSTVR